ncbi:MAG: NAD(+)/NADH kinase [Deltaproteobacteria bacterium]|jgi:predicted polyphosphate/ATP-dependent NAD kinase|nr:NAD(+)/NADH kinase [Deltaproteobacteria bacterium]
MKTVTVGLIANPASGKDIRRLVAYGTVFDNQEKISMVRRMLLGLLVGGTDRVLYMPDYNGLVVRALDGLGSKYSYVDGILRAKDQDGPGLRVEMIPLEVTATQDDSRRAAALMAQAKVDCLLVLGGDGTSRQVAKGASNTPILAISTGTNNVFPWLMEATTAGLAAAAVAAGRAGPIAVYRAKRLVIRVNGEYADQALVDAAVSRKAWVGSRAVWEPCDLTEAVFTRGEPWNLGLASIIGLWDPVGPTDPYGAYVLFSPVKANLMAPIAPGLIRPVGVELAGRLLAGQTRVVGPGPLTVALDGERELEVGASDQATIEVDLQGPLVVDPHLALAGATADRFFGQPALVGRLDRALTTENSLNNLGGQGNFGREDS